MRLFPSVPWELVANFMRVRKSVSTWSFCATFKAVALLGTQKILSEY